MIESIPGYTLGERIYESHKTIVYRGRRQSDDLAVVIKLAVDIFAVERSRKFEHEYELNKLLPPEDPVGIRLETNGRIDPSEIACSDFTTRLRIPKRLYGRARETTVLREVFALARTGEGTSC